MLNEFFPKPVASDTEKVQTIENFFKDVFNNAPSIKELAPREKDLASIVLSELASSFAGQTKIAEPLPKDRIGHEIFLHPSLRALDEKRKSNGKFYPLEQKITLKADLTELEFLHVVVHEILHSFSFQSADIGSSDNIEIRRLGFLIRHRKAKDSGDKIYGIGNFLNEGMTEYLTKREHKKIIENSKDKKLIEEYAITKKLCEDLHNKDIDEIASATRGEEIINGVKKKGIKLHYYAYKQERKYLLDLWETLARRERKTVVEIEDLFVKSYFNGNLLEIGRLCKKHFGPKSLEHILDGTMSLQEKP